MCLFLFSNVQRSCDVQIAMHFINLLTSYIPACGNSYSNMFSLRVLKQKRVKISYFSLCLLLMVFSVISSYLCLKLIELKNFRLCSSSQPKQCVEICILRVEREMWPRHFCKQCNEKLKILRKMNSSCLIRKDEGTIWISNERWQEIYNSKRWWEWRNDNALGKCLEYVSLQYKVL